jgi:hypothetical protein
MEDTTESPSKTQGKWAELLPELWLRILFLLTTEDCTRNGLGLCMRLVCNTFATIKWNTCYHHKLLQTQDEVARAEAQTDVLQCQTKFNINCVHVDPSEREEHVEPSVAFQSTTQQLGERAQSLQLSGMNVDDFDLSGWKLLTFLYLYQCLTLTDSVDGTLSLPNQLRTLIIDDCALCKFPKVSSFSNLSILKFFGCQMLHVPYLPPSIQDLTFDWCIDLKRLPTMSPDCTPCLEKLTIQQSHSLRDLHTQLRQMTSLTSFCIDRENMKIDDLFDWFEGGRYIVQVAQDIVSIRPY